MANGIVNIILRTTGDDKVTGELVKPVGKDESLLRANYDLTLREIVLRLKKEKEVANG